VTSNGPEVVFQVTPRLAAICSRDLRAASGVAEFARQLTSFIGHEHRSAVIPKQWQSRRW
jgi:hypothetical protein